MRMKMPQRADTEVCPYEEAEILFVMACIINSDS